jgi:multidrug efflux system membrane fusion protein
VPVVAGTVEQKDVPIYLEWLGMVQGFNTVTLHTRVDGQLDKVLFSEGQNVKAGDLLAQISPRPYQAALDQAIAKKAQDGIVCQTVNRPQRSTLCAFCASVKNSVSRTLGGSAS